MIAHMSYGKTGLELVLSDDGRIRTLWAREQRALDDPLQATREALARPIESPPLAQIARGRRDACVVVSDITRPVPHRDILPPLLDTLEGCGIAAEKITILIATGIHRPNEGAELIELLGEGIASRCRCVNHYSRREGECRFIGQTRCGIPVFVNQRYLDADLKILTGLIEPHFWAGFSGGRKAILPGICSLETMKHMHGAAMIEACMANYGRLEGNLFHEAGLEVARMAGVDFILNVTVDEKKRPTGVFAGHYDAAHRAGARLCEAGAGFELDEPADLAIVSGGGYPLDKTFYQAAKPITVAWLALRKGGRSLILTECSEGLGSAPFVELLDMARSPQHLLELLRKPGFFQVDQWCAQTMAQMLLDNRIAVYCSGAAPERLRRYGYEPVADPQAWVDSQLERLGPQARVLVIPDGPYVYARVGRRT